MASNVTINSDYKGGFSGYLRATLLSGQTLGDGLITVMPNVKYQHTLTTMALDNILADKSCNFSPVGDLSTNEVVLAPKVLQVDLQVCKQDLVGLFEAEKMGFSAHNPNAKNLDFTKFVMEYMIAKIAESVERLIYVGDATVPGEFDGIFTSLNASATHTGSVKIVGEASTVANAEAQIAEVYSEIPEAVRLKDDTAMLVSPNVFDNYIVSLNQRNSYTPGIYSKGQYDYLGVKMIRVSSMKLNTVLALRKSNWVFATGVESDQNLIQIFDQSEYGQGQNINFTMRFTGQVREIFGAEVISYGINLA